MERTCKVCGKTFPLEFFPTRGEYRLRTCRSCHNKKKAEWRKNHARSEETKRKDALRDRLRREEKRANTGRTYYNAKAAERARSYAIRYEQEHKDDPKHREMKRLCGKNAWEKRKMKEEVRELDEFFNSDFDMEVL